MGLTRPTLVAVALCAGCATGLRPPPSLVETDLDGDTRVDRIETIEKGRVARVVDAPPPGSKPQRTVVIAIDAVPYVVFARLQRQGLFREFFPAARMIAPLPSLTNVGYAAILKTAPVLGFEDRYYDPVENEVGGGVLDRFRKRYKGVAPFHEVFNWEPPHLWGVTVYYFPMTVSRAQLRKIEEILHTRQDPELVLYFGGLFDALARMKGTHGSATFDSTVGFVASNIDPLPQTVRAGEVFPYLGLSRVPEPPRLFVDPCSGTARR